MESSRTVCAHCRRFKKREHSEHICRFDERIHAWIEECSVCGMVDYHDNELNARNLEYAVKRKGN